MKMEKKKSSLNVYIYQILVESMFLKVDKHTSTLITVNIYTA